MTFPSRSVAVAVALSLAGAATAQVPQPPDYDTASRAKANVYRMRNGTVRVKDDPKNREQIKVVAQSLAFSLGQPPFNGEPAPKKGGPIIPPGFTPIDYLITDTENFTVREGGALPAGAGTAGKPSQDQIEYSDEFGKAMADAVKVVLETANRPIERVNAVRMLAIAARIPAPSLADPLVAIVKNPNAPEAEKLYAFQGLRNLLEQSDVTDPTRPIFPGTPGTAKLAEVAAALNAYVTQKRAFKDDKERAVIEYVRREAVAALARVKDAVFRKPNREVIFRPGWALARVMENDPSVGPAFTIQERTEAAAGLAQMRIDADLNLDVAAYIQARMLVEFARAANEDAGRAATDGTLPIMHWKVAAARWSYNLALWRGQMQALPAGRGAGPALQLADLAIALLATIEKGGAGAPNGVELRAINQWGQNNPPKAWPAGPALLFKDDPASILPFPVRPADPTLKTPDPKAADPKKAAPPADPKGAPPKGKKP